MWRIWSSIFSGNDTSSSSFIAGIAIFMPTMMMNMATTIAAMGSSIRPFSPRNIAPATPTSVATDENASDL